MVDSHNKKQMDHAYNNCKNVMWPTVFAILSLLVCLIAYADSQLVFTIIFPLIPFNNVKKMWPLLSSWSSLVFLVKHNKLYNF